jgi:esterase/lipase
MIKTSLLQFKNSRGKILRGIFLHKENNKSLVVMVSGFERKATTEKKFKALSDELIKRGVDSFRFDYEGLGLSDGDFSKFSLKRLKNDLLDVLSEIKNKKNYQSISLVVHSISGCLAPLIQEKNKFRKLVLLGPALNQKDLLRYYFVKNKMKKKDSGIKITWDNFKDYLEEEEFKKDIQREDKMTKENYIFSDYFKENMNKDYSKNLKNTDNVLLIHGDNDDKVPLESLNIDFSKKIIVKKGDHNLERPDMMSQWLEEAVNFLKS